MNNNSVVHGGMRPWIRIHWPVIFVVLALEAIPFTMVYAQKTHPHSVCDNIELFMGLLLGVIILLVAPWIQRRRHRIAGLKSTLVLKAAWWFCLVTTALTAAMLYLHLVFPQMFRG
jgi:hypothetical protein